MSVIKGTVNLILVLRIIVETLKGLVIIAD